MGVRTTVVSTVVAATLCFPMAGHSETAWGTRLHLPLQFLNGAVARAYRVNRPVLGDQPFERGKASPERP